MDFWRTILVLLRRWYIALPALMLVFVAAGSVYLSQPVRYTSSSALVLTAPVSGATQRADPKRAVDLTNPLLNFDQGLSATAAILVYVLSTPTVANQLGVGPSGDPSFQVNNGTTNPELLVNTPFVVITAQSTSPALAKDLVARVTQRARQELVNQQKALKAPPSTYIVLSEVVSPTPPQRTQQGTRLRPAISALAVGLIASVAAAFGAESILDRPGRRRRAESAPARRTAGGSAADFRGNGAVQAGAGVPGALPLGAALDGQRQD